MLQGRGPNGLNGNHNMRGSGPLRESGNLVVDHKGAKGGRRLRQPGWELMSILNAWMMTENKLA